MNESLPRRLFVPLASKPFEWFRTGQKRWELRRYGRQYTERHVFLGRPVELRKGYQSQADALWGTVVNAVKADSLDEFFDQVPFHQVIPPARTRKEAVQMAASILGVAESQPTSVFGFEVQIR